MKDLILSERNNMIKDSRIWIAKNGEGEDIFIEPSMANRHGLIAGATGSGKTVTLKVLAESFSEISRSPSKWSAEAISLYVLPSAP